MSAGAAYGVLVHDGYHGSHVDLASSEQEARDMIAYYERLNSTRGTDGVRGVLVTREPGGEWTEAVR